MKQLSEWPRPRSGRGLHVTTKANTSIYWGENNKVRDEHIALWHSMGVDTLKMLTYGDSQLQTTPMGGHTKYYPTQAFVEAGFMVIMRLYREPIALDPPPHDLLLRCRDAGVTYVESFTNEPELEWRMGNFPTADTIDRLARSHIIFADSCARAGVLPCTPAIQGDRLPGWFAPFCRRIVELGRRDALEGSAVAGHWRPGDFKRGDKLFPPDSPGLEPDGNPGFVFRSYEVWDKFIRDLLGGPLPLLGTEAGYEPNEVKVKEDDSNETVAARHASLNTQIDMMTWQEALFCQCYWTWLPDWSESGWWENHRYGTMPIVKTFQQIPPVIRTLPVEPPIIVPPVVIPPIEPPTVSREDSIRLQIKDFLHWETFPWLTKEAMRRDLLRTDITPEIHVFHSGKEYVVRVFGGTVLGCPDGQYTESETFQFPFFKEG